MRWTAPEKKFVDFEDRSWSFLAERSCRVPRDSRRALKLHLCLYDEFSRSGQEKKEPQVQKV